MESDENSNPGNDLAQSGVAGPGPSTAANTILCQTAGHHWRIFDDREDSRATVWTEGAGHVLRKDMPPKPMQDIRDEHGDVLMAEEGNAFYPFASELDWKVAQWAIKDRPGNNAFDRLLEIPGVRGRTSWLVIPQYTSTPSKVDSMPEKAGTWKTKLLSFKDQPGEKYTIRFRDPIEAIKSLWKDPELSPTMVFRPAKMYSDKEKKNRIFSEMWTSKWWHVCQSKLPLGATMAPVIIATDKTQLTQFSGSKSAYPIYLTIGNIPKAICRKPSKKACILIGYLSIDKID
ncbi:hypothetical protein CPB84DRAFT_1847370 [Gymnopilus junonius]|uniref:Uncharacterized protein n=1 Tax=Gymnopilus junonius TaxID=109634 RepID=A0A9P5NMD7_GYMJU|nr:hypothetical protein CPB84DRAFT_1847370 [Gymnopilus junonius]